MLDYCPARPRKAPTMNAATPRPNAARRKAKKPLATPAKVSRAYYVFSAYRETARALENAAFSVPRPNADRAALVREVSAMRDAMQSARLADLRAACARAEEIPLAHAAARFPAAVAWTRFLARIAPEQMEIA